MPHRSMRIRFNFVFLIFVASIDYENISTTKISRFTVYCICCKFERIRAHVTVKICVTFSLCNSSYID